MLFAASVTPFVSPSGAVDYAWIPQHLRWLADQGVDGVVPCGTTGEGPSLSVAERQAVIDTVLAHRGGLRVIAGTGCAALSDTIALTCYALARGAEAALVLPPFYFKGLSDDGLLAFYRSVCAALPDGGRILLYHIPPISQIAIPVSVIDGLLASHPGCIYGLKDSGGDADHTAMLIQRYPQLHIFTGSAPLLGRALSDGAAGGIFALANAFPHVLRMLFDVYALGGDVSGVQGRVVALSAALRPYSAAAALKAILPRVAQVPRCSVRLPLVDLSAQEVDALWCQIDALVS